MRVLMLESHAGVASAAVDRLIGAGCSVVRCDTDDRRYPCRGLVEGGECPLEQHVDVAVLVQEVGTQHLEHGAVCAARSRVPVVAVGDAELAERFPINPWVAAGVPDLLDTCAQAAGDGRRHSRAVIDRLLGLGVVTEADVDPLTGSVSVAVERGLDRLVMTIALARFERDRESAIVRAASQALRDFDRGPSVIDVLVRYV